MTFSRPPGPLAPLPIRPRPQHGQTTESYARQLARANHLKPSYLRSVLCDPPQPWAAISPSRLAAVSGRPIPALEHALADLGPQPRPGRQRTAQRQPPQRNPQLFAAIRRDAATYQMPIRALAARHQVDRHTIRQALSQAPRPRAGISARPLISTWLLADPQLTPKQIWERLLDEHDVAISYVTACHYRRTMTPRARINDNPNRKTP